MHQIDVEVVHVLDQGTFVVRGRILLLLSLWAFLLSDLTFPLICHIFVNQVLVFQVKVDLDCLVKQFAHVGLVEFEDEPCSSVFIDGFAVVIDPLESGLCAFFLQIRNNLVQLFELVLEVEVDWQFGI